jgi:hypothetical protein
VQQIRKSKPTAPQRTTAAKPARTRRSQMLVELKRPRPMRAPARRGLFPHLGKRFGEEYLPVDLNDCSAQWRSGI